MTNAAYIHRFITSWGFTIIVETAVLCALLMYVYRRKDIPLKDMLFAGLLSSFATIPYVWFVFPYIVNWSRQTSLYVSEPVVFFIEALIYNRFLKVNWPTAFALSFICNAASYLLGPILRSLGLWIYW